MVDIPVLIRTKRVVCKKLIKQKRQTMTSKILAYSSKYSNGTLNAKQIAKATGSTARWVYNTFSLKGVTKTRNESTRLEAFARFYELGIYSADELSKILGYSRQGCLTRLSNMNIKKLKTSERIDRMVTDGFSFDAALKFCGKSMEQYIKSAGR